MGRYTLTPILDCSSDWTLDRFIEKIIDFPKDYQKELIQQKKIGDENKKLMEKWKEHQKENLKRMYKGQRIKNSDIFERGLRKNMGIMDRINYNWQEVLMGGLAGYFLGNKKAAKKAKKKIRELLDYDEDDDDDRPRKKRRK